MAARVIGPAGIPDYRPLNPWGRPMPKPKRAMRDRFARALSEDLWQVFVEGRDGKLRPVGPRVVEMVARTFCAAIGEEIAKGNELRWSNPHVLRVKAA